ncbi:adenosine deaminase [Microlunatus soli]|uniref:Aminodeoxyfutalosine deaminase n=1 Tax=Microlunatus soli TaxID=630515 RepID=A0A1H1TGW0_9ACTN|nr:adenosine deaminase [Microlunatus soli]SDS58769.1 aminodeoxyfutalosine deaminase [Microlunatus soli]
MSEDRAAAYSHAWIAAVPKIELHVHHVGATSADTVADLAARHPESGVPTDPSALEEFYRFTDFDHFLQVYAAISRLLSTPEDVYRLTVGNLADLAAQHVRYVEMTVTPNGILTGGVPREGLVEALDAARAAAARDWDLTVNWILDIPAFTGEPAEVVMDLCEQRQPAGLVALGLGGPETPRADFAAYFGRARALGLGSVPHAGEASGPESIRAALQVLKADRIGHGIRAVEDPAVLVELADAGVHLEVSPTSNVRTRVVQTYEDHPLPTLLAAGVPVSINSDDPPMFGTTLTRELQIAAQLVGSEQIPRFLRNAIGASFASDTVKRSYLAELADAETHARDG